jgi:hypothetical protein
MSTKRTKPGSDERSSMIEAILSSMIDGKSLRQSSIKAGTTAQSFIRWCDEDAKLAERYAHAREAMIDKLADELLEIADSPVAQTPSGATDNGAVQNKRLQVDTRKWILSKIAPKKYGEKLEVSGDASNPLVQRIERVVVKND